MTTTAIYTRVSTEKQAEREKSVASQVSESRPFAAEIPRRALRENEKPYLPPVNGLDNFPLVSIIPPSGGKTEDGA